MKTKIRAKINCFDETPPLPADLPKTFTQEEVNRFLAEDKKKFKTQQQSVLDELEALKTKTSMSATERIDFETKLEEMRNQLLTKEELANQEQTKIKKKFEKDSEQKNKDIEIWKAKYTESTIIRSLTDAAIGNDAFEPEQIVAILRPNTRLSEVLDEEGKGTGEYISKIKFNSIDKDNNPVVLDLTPSEAIKKMTEMEKHENLFKGKGSPGSGRNTHGAGKPLDLQELAKDPEKYRKARKEGKIDFD